MFHRGPRAELTRVQTHTSGTTTVTIGVVGLDPFGESLDQVVRDKTVGTKRIAIRRFAGIDELEPCNILFISQSESSRLEEILKTLEGTATLTVGEDDEFALRGGIIRFFTRKARSASRSISTRRSTRAYGSARNCSRWQGPWRERIEAVVDFGHAVRRGLSGNCSLHSPVRKELPQPHRKRLSMLDDLSHIAQPVPSAVGSLFDPRSHRFMHQTHGQLWRKQALRPSSSQWRPLICLGR